MWPAFMSALAFHQSANRPSAAPPVHRRCSAARVVSEGEQWAPCVTGLYLLCLQVKVKQGRSLVLALCSVAEHTVKTLPGQMTERTCALEMMDLKLRLYLKRDRLDLLILCGCAV